MNVAQSPWLYYLTSVLLYHYTGAIYRDCYTRLYIILYASSDKAELYYSIWQFKLKFRTSRLISTEGMSCAQTQTWIRFTWSLVQHQMYFTSIIHNYWLNLLVTQIIKRWTKVISQSSDYVGGSEMIKLICCQLHKISFTLIYGSLHCTAIIQYCTVLQLFQYYIQ